MTTHAARISSGLTALALLAMVAPSHASSPWVLGKGEFHSDFLGSFYSSSTYHDDTGERPDLGATYETRRVANSTQLGWRNKWTFRFDVPFESNTFQEPGTEGMTQTGLSDLLLGVRYGLMSGPTAMSLEAAWQAPMGYHREFQPPLGDGRQSAIVMLHAGATLPGLNGFVQAAGGYRARIDGFADTDPVQNDVLASADMGFWIGNSLMFAGSYRGRIESSDADLPATEHLVGPRITYRVDDFLDVFAGSMHTFSAENALHQNQYLVGFATKRTQLDRLKGFLGSKRRP
jgi:hypothetical protein